jgi:hypothetical protein
MPRAVFKLDQRAILAPAHQHVTGHTFLVMIQRQTPIAQGISQYVVVYIRTRRAPEPTGVAMEVI